MKYAAAVLSLAAVVAAKPAILNTSFNVVAGQPFEIQYSGCEAGCTILLKSGPSGNLDTVSTLASAATGTATSVNIGNVPSGLYAFEIVDSTGANNYSEQFQAGSGVATTSASASATSSAVSTTSAPVSTTTSAESTSSVESSTTKVSSSTSSSSAESSSATTLSTVRSSSTVTTPSASATKTTATTSSTATTVPSTVPEGGAGSLTGSLSLAVGAVVAFALMH